MVGKKLRKVALNVLYAKKRKTYPAYVSKHNSNREQQIILLMILNQEKRKAKSEGCKSNIRGCKTNKLG